MFLSAPVVLFNGTVRGSTATSMTIFDDPQAKCDLDLQQTVISGGSVIHVSPTTRSRLIETPESNRENRSTVMSPSMSFPSVTLELERAQLLQIDLHISFDMFLDGPADVAYSTGPSDADFLVRTPQWSITSLD